jgi:hypothetical protein
MGCRAKGGASAGGGKPALKLQATNGLAVETHGQIRGSCLKTLSMKKRKGPISRVSQLNRSLSSQRGNEVTTPTAGDSSSVGADAVLTSSVAAVQWDATAVVSRPLM